MTRHYIKGIGRIVVEDASLIDLCLAHRTILYQIESVARVVDMREGAKRYASGLVIERDLAAEICKRAKERRYQ